MTAPTREPVGLTGKRREWLRLRPEEATADDIIAAMPRAVEGNMQGMPVPWWWAIRILIAELLAARALLVAWAARVAELEQAIATHRHNVWGEGDVDHDEDVALYRAYPMPGEQP